MLTFISFEVERFESYVARKLISEFAQVVVKERGKNIFPQLDSQMVTKMKGTGSLDVNKLLRNDDFV